MDSNDTNDDRERVQIRSELSSMSFEDLQKLKEKLGSKVYNEAVFGMAPKRRTNKHTVFRRENKNRPREMSSKRPVPLIDAKDTEQKEVRDPRFDSLCGTYNAKAFKRSYSFISDIKQNELKMLNKELSKEDDPERQEQIKYLIQRMENQAREERRTKEKEDKKNTEYQEKVKLMKEGKTPTYVNKSDKKIYNLVEQYEELKATGKLEKHITKHRKKNAQKTRKGMNVM